MPTPISQTFREAFLTSADSAHTMSFADFMRLALYHPQLGYYRQTRQRVGYAPGTDFYTASTSGPLFGQLVAAACASLVRAHGDTPETHTFVEIGAETDAGVLAGVEHPFAAARTVRVELAAGGNKVNATVDARDEARLLQLLDAARARAV